MPKVDVYSLKRPEEVFVDYILKDSSNPDVEIEFRFKSPTLSSMVEVSTIAENVKEFYKGEIKMRPVDGKHVEVNENTLTLMATVFVLQAPVNDEDRYTIEELIALSELMPSGVMDMLAKVQKLTEGLLGLEKNPTQAAMPPQSAPTVPITNPTRKRRRG